ncbi:DNA-directed RNA polymerase subunit beta [Jeotgalibacillus soli]|uniref:DNA-directed RNA polymerase subunit beta n=1 Tax=Jeotgalibacillus soli TaxID=889306 RepID=A0A0C2VZH5_9BACL|nr:DNA-directed RNA polymerase subunit beta [Jeotgalibacillus soli]KIL49786.1 hypothetical protein KP78_12540 [Jeotgalibacillus soli]
MAENRATKNIEQQNTKQEDQEPKRKPRWVQVRLFPITVRVLLVLLLVAGSLVGGLMIGYGVIGDGNPLDALNKETWTHIYDIVMKDES